MGHRSTPPEAAEALSRLAPDRQRILAKIAVFRCDDEPSCGVPNDAVTIRPATESDHDAIIDVVRAAFAMNDSHGQEEVDIVLTTWRRKAVVDDLELVAVGAGSQIVGYVVAAAGDLDGRIVVGVAPVAVAPPHQNKGIGSALMNELLERADAAGLPLVVLLGNPVYYARFGFEPAGPRGITYVPVGAGSPYFQMRRLAAYDPSYRGDFRYCWEVPPS